MHKHQAEKYMPAIQEFIPTHTARTDGGLVGLDLGDGISGGEGIALGNVPLGYRSGLHGGGQRWHPHNKMIWQIIGRHVPNNLWPPMGRGRGTSDGTGRWQRGRGEEISARQGRVASRRKLPPRRPN